jgi:hypothetical protein
LIFSDFHYDGTLLNPHVIHDMELHDDQHTMVELMRIFQKCFDTNEEFQAIKFEFNLYFHTIIVLWKSSMESYESEGSGSYMVVYKW